MSSGPEHRMEKLLRAFAKKRQDEAGAPLELHPATRRMLQGEVTRRVVKRSPAPGFFSQLIGRLGPRFAWGIGILAILAIAVAVLFPMTHQQKNESQIARNDRVPALTEDSEARRSTPAAAVPVSAQLADAKAQNTVEMKEPTATATAELAQVQKSTEALTPSAANRPQAEQPLLFGLEKDHFDSSSSSPSMRQRDSATLVLEKGRVLTLTSNALGDNVTPATPGPTDMLARVAALPGSNQKNVSFSGVAPQKPSLLDTAGVPIPAMTPEPGAGIVIAAATPPPPSLAPVTKSVAQSFGGAGVSAPAAASAPTLAAAAQNESVSRSFAENGTRRKEETGAVLQKFARVEASTATKALAAKTATANPVLASFQVQQTGQQMRIIDGDGSIYIGTVTTTDPKIGKSQAVRSKQSSPIEKTGSKEKMAFVDADKQVAQNFSFQVTGTNLSLGQRVVFTGNLTATPELTAKKSNGASFDTRGQSSPALPNETQWSSSRISGRVIIGQGKEISIDAMPTKP